MKMIVLVS